MLEIIVIIIGSLLAVLGLIGCIVPAIPGPPLNFFSLLLLAVVIKNPFTLEFYLIWGAITAVVVILDYLLPIAGAKIYKATSYGIWGSLIGMIIGMIFFPPFGMIPGLFIGAVAGELLAGKKSREAFKVGAVTFVASLLMIVFKLAVSGILTYYFVEKAVSTIF